MAARAFQIQVRGTLDGVTPLVVPDPLPAQIGGVTKIDAGVGVNVGLIDPRALVPTTAPLWVRSYQVEFADAPTETRAGRIAYRIPGSQQDEKLVEDMAGRPVLMPLFTACPRAIVPQGATIAILTDDTDDTFTGAPTPGPHFVYLEIEELPDDESVALVEDLQRAASSQLGSAKQSFSSFQPVAASLTEDLGMVIPQDQYASTLGSVSKISQASVSIGTAPAALESMQIDIVLVQNVAGGTLTIGSITIDSTFAADTRVLIPINQIDNSFAIGDRLRVIRTYVAGGAPAPMDNTLVSVDFEPQLLNPLP